MAAFAELRPQIGIAAACVALSINRAGIYRTRDRLARRQCAMFPHRRRPRPPLALSEAERSVLLLVLNSERFADLAPAAVFAILLDEGRYHGSVSTMYRLLAAEGQTGERRKQRTHTTYAKPELLAVRPNEVWSWDISVPQQAA
jgi:putative transposase